MRRRITRAVTAAALGPLALGLAGCGGTTSGGDNAVTRFVQSIPGGERLAPGREAQPRQTAMEQREAASTVITELQARQSVLEPGSTYGQVARAVMSSSARSSEAELRGARLRAEAASKNWLPKIGPSISLNSLGEFVSTLLVEQVLFDNGRKKAERDYAAHDVELAAVALSEDSNARVHDALTLFLAAEEGRERMVVADRSLNDMSHFEWVMNERVKGGVSDRSDLNVIRQKLSQIRAERESAAGDRKAALAEIAAMTGAPLDGVEGIPALSVNAGNLEPIAVLRAKAERDRAIAEAKIARASHLPGLSASANVTDGGAQYGAVLQAGEMLGLGTGASLKAIEASKEAADRKVAQAREDANRSIAALRQREQALTSQLGDARQLERAAKRNLDLFQAQYKGGARQVMDVVGVYETWADQTRTAMRIKYDLARVQLAIARDLGVLADGRDI